MTTAAIPKSPREFATAVMALVAKALESDQSQDQLQGQVDALMQSYAGRVPNIILKAVESRQMLYGWASVVTKDGETVEDRQGDVMDIDNLRGVVHEFMGERVGKAMHDGHQVGEIVDSFVMDAEVAAAFGVDFGCEGWMVGYHVKDDAVWKRVQSGELRAFSIGGDGIRTPIV